MIIIRGKGYEAYHNENTFTHLVHDTVAKTVEVHLINDYNANYKHVVEVERQ